MKKKEEEITLTKADLKKIIEHGRRELVKKRFTPEGRVRNPITETFTFKAQVCGGSCHIRIPRFWLGRTLEVKIKEVKENE